MQVVRVDSLSVLTFNIPMRLAMSQQWSPYINYLLSFALVAALSIAPMPGEAADDTSRTEFEQQVLDVIQKNPEAILESLSQYQQAREKINAAARLELAGTIKNHPKDFLQGSPVLGSQNAKDYVFVFADFECPYCSQVRDTLEQFVTKNQSVALVYKNYPLTQIHPDAMDAARAAWAAQQQGKFWQFHDILYANQNRLGEDLYLEAAKDLQLNLGKFNVDRNSEAAASSIARDMDLADQLGLSGTPFFLLNGQTFSGLIDASFLQKKL